MKTFYVSWLLVWIGLLIQAEGFPEQQIEGSPVISKLKTIVTDIRNFLGHARENPEIIQENIPIIQLNQTTPLLEEVKYQTESTVKQVFVNQQVVPEQTLNTTPRQDQQPSLSKDDLYEAFGRLLAHELRKYDPQTLSRVKQAIHTIIFHADTKKGVLAVAK